MVYASFSKRFLAAVIDSLILGVFYLILLPFPAIGNIFIIIITLAYRIVFETSVMRGTPGKYWMKITLVNSNGDNIDWKQSLIRFLTSFFSSAFLWIGYFFYFFTEKKQTLHDLAANTYVTNGIIVEVSIWDTFRDQLKIYIDKIKNLKS